MRRVDIDHGRAVAALDVVGEDFQFRLCREIGIVGEQQRVARHFRIGLLGVGSDPDLALENALGAVEHDVADDFRRCRVRHVVAEHEGHIGVRFAAEQVDAAQLEIGALARGDAMDFLAHQLAAGIDDEQPELGVRAEVEIDLGEMAVGFTLLLQDDPGDLRALVRGSGRRPWSRGSARR